MWLRTDRRRVSFGFSFVHGGPCGASGLARSCPSFTWLFADSRSARISSNDTSRYLLLLVLDRELRSRREICDRVSALVTHHELQERARHVLP